MAKKKVSIGVAMAALRMVKMTSQERSDIARAAVNVRWANYRAAKKAATQAARNRRKAA